MTVSSTANRISYTGNGATTAFSFPYLFFQNADLVVISTVIATGIQTTKVLGTDYTISGTQDASGIYRSGGTVNASVAPPSTVTWTIYRDPSPVQNVQHSDNDPLPAASIDNPLDLLTCIEQRTRDLISRALVQPDGDANAIARLPSVVSRANAGAGSYAGYDLNGNPTVFTIANGGSSVPISIAMTPVVESSTLAAALALLGGLAAGVVNSPGALTTLASATVGAAAETFLTLLRNKGNGAANDFLERLALDGMSSTGVQRTFASLLAQIVTATNGAEAGQLLFQTIVAGALTTAATLKAGLQLGAPTGGDQGAGTVNATGLFINGVAAITGATFTKPLYDSGAVALPSLGAASTFTHGLGAAPAGAEILLQNVTGELGYSTGDILSTFGVFDAGQRGFWWQVDSGNTTQLKVIQGTSALSIPTKGGGAGGNITQGNWNMIVRAWK